MRWVVLFFVLSKKEESEEMEGASEQPERERDKDKDSKDRDDRSTPRKSMKDMTKAERRALQAWAAALF